MFFVLKNRESLVDFDSIMDVGCYDADWNEFIAQVCTCVNIQLYIASTWAVRGFIPICVVANHDYYVTKTNHAFLIFQHATLKNAGRPGTRLVTTHVAIH